MRKRLMIIVLMIFACFAISAQNVQDPVLLEINGERVTKSEFVKIYEKNNKHQHIVDPVSVEEYLDLYINFRLKVKEAKALGMDTAESFLKELKTYRDQLAEPYLTDSKVTEKLIEEAYERMKYDIRASHIVIALQGDVSPQDTLEAYNRILKIRNEVLQGKDFAEAAEKYSDDPTARDRIAPSNQSVIKGNKGDLNYFTVFNMIYPFESAAYNTEPGEISMPVRSQFGYHIIKVTDKLPSPGQISIAHIMIETKPDATYEENQQAEKRINDLYQKIMDGESFDQIAMQYSEHRPSASRGGLLAISQSNNMMPEFVVALNSISEPGNISKPFETIYGWHILKLLDKQPLKSYDELYHELKNRLRSSQRSRLSQQSLANKLKEEYHFKDNPDNLQLFYDIVDNSIFLQNWKIPTNYELDEIMFEFADKAYTQMDFAEFLFERQVRRTPQQLNTYIDRMHQEFEVNRIIDYENSILQDKYPEFKELYNEYHDGILLFELTDKMVWSKSMKDTAGLVEFYNKNIENYLGEKQIDATIYYCQDRKTASKVRRQLINSSDSDTLHMQILRSFNKDRQQIVIMDKGVYKLSDVDVFQKIALKEGVSKLVSNNNKTVIVHIHEVIPKQPKPLNQIRGLVIADYQNYLEEKWTKKLREKYNITLNKEVFNKIKKQIK